MREFFSDVSILSPPSKTLQKQLWTIFVPVMVFCNLSRTRILMDMDCWYLFKGLKHAAAEAGGGNRFPPRFDVSMIFLHISMKSSKNWDSDESLAFGTFLIWNFSISAKFSWFLWNLQA